MSIPFELPLKAGEAAALADLVLQMADGRKLNDDFRQRLANRAAALNLTSITPHLGSLQQDPTHQAAFFMAVDGTMNGKTEAILLRFAAASSPTSALFPNSFLIGRMRPESGKEIVINAIPFSSYDGEAIRIFTKEVDKAFFPRPQASQSAIAVGNRHPEISLPAAFAAFRSIYKKTGINLASTVQLSATREMTTDDVIAARDGENPVAAGHTRVSIKHLYEAGVWAAIRAGWREGYNAEADHFIITGDTDDAIARSVEATKVAIQHAAGYTKFTTDTSRLFELEADTRHPRAWSDAQVESRFGQILSEEEGAWVLNEFSRPFATGNATYEFATDEIMRLAVKFARSLKLNEDLYDYIRIVKSQQPGSRVFDFEPSIDEAETLTTPKELLFYMHWLKSRGRPAQLVPPNLGFKKRQAYPVAIASSQEAGVGLEDYVFHKMWPELLPRVVSEYGGKPLEEFRARVTELAAVARFFNGTLSIHSGSGKQAEVLEQIARATNGRWNYKISGELQLQLFDVLYEQPESSPWRKLYERMVARCNAFAARNAFGDESELAQKYLAMGRGSYLGEALRGRVDGNLFLVFWLGNVNGSRDSESPDGDHRFFKEKLDELPGDLLAEVRRRNADYIIWLADQLRG
ncbi:MAG: tagaturonate epimerase family protein [Bryobacteraceae bacterium]